MFVGMTPTTFALGYGCGVRSSGSTPILPSFWLPQTAWTSMQRVTPFTSTYVENPPDVIAFLLNFRNCLIGTGGQGMFRTGAAGKWRLQ